MPSSDKELDLWVEQLAIINVPDLVRYLCETHPQAAPHDLAIRLLEILKDAKYTMGFEERVAKG